MHERGSGTVADVCKFRALMTQALVKWLQRPGTPDHHTVMQARMKSPVMIIPDAMKALYALRSSAEKGGVPQRLLTLLELRVSQINGCSLCVDMHAVELKQQGEKD